MAVGSKFLVVGPLKKITPTIYEVIKSSTQIRTALFLLSIDNYGIKC